MTKTLTRTVRLNTHRIEIAVGKPGFSFKANGGGSWTMRYKNESIDIWAKRLSSRPLQDWVERANKFIAGVGKTKIVSSLLAKADKDGFKPLIRIPVNTPAYLDPSTETYHSM